MIFADVSEETVFYSLRRVVAPPVVPETEPIEVIHTYKKVERHEVEGHLCNAHYIGNPKIKIPKEMWFDDTAIVYLATSN